MYKYHGILGSAWNLVKKSWRSSWLESQIINIKLKKNQQKVPGPPQSCRPRTGGSVGISNTDTGPGYNEIPQIAK